MAGLGKSSRESESLFAYVGLASHEDGRSGNQSEGWPIAIRMSRDRDRDRPIHPFSPRAVPGGAGSRSH
jgi:hypothetical protein